MANIAKTQFTNTNKQFQVQFLSLQKQIVDLQKVISPSKPEDNVKEGA
ncbi:hypothetical protein [Lentilactobacillus sp. SPB1-3]|uniref:Uncharacterized protein n=1 Tax=Lentilactobacillus terminaliae TaxID=3003483 RepID=A0ACD5DBV6_9LACO|nr:hypothetical protein [Lentilactobacillus sp. SPB1-3]MCZ0977137.1 hypothetical protein [Lentilactobacillus sp. SPB1-3]